MLRRIKALKTAVLRLRVQEAHVKGDAAKLDTALVRGLLDGFFSHEARRSRRTGYG